ncbi:sensor histidine kinase [Candidatus Jorgensenbacteria bacterium]|nr:sensor histidine kinase [Candidatus Jorgensenbacteria bacterium]
MRKKILGNRLSHKVFLMLVLVGVLPIIILGFLALYSLNVSHRIDVAYIEQKLINQKIEEIEKFFDEIVSTLELQVGFEQTSEIAIESQHFLLKQFLNEHAAFEEVAFVSLTGRESSKWSRIYGGRVSDEELIDLSHLERFRKALGGDRYVGSTYRTLKGPMISISMPVRNKNGIIISVISAEINLSELQSIVKRSTLGSEGYVYMVDGDGFLLAHSQEENLEIKDMNDWGFVRSLVGGRRYLGVENLQRYESPWGETVLSLGDYLPLLKVGIITEWPIDDADRIVNTVRNQIAIVGFLVLLFTGLVSAILTNRIVRPIKTLEVGTERIARGQFDQPVSITTNDEIEDLGDAFNKMMQGLKRLEELKEEFVFIAAHELRTPVTAIKGYISMVLDGDAGEVNPEVQKFLSEVRKASDRLNQLVNDLLQIARSEAGRLKIEVQSIDIAEAVQSALSELKPLALEKSIKLVYNPVTTPPVLADSDRLKEVLINLVGNAIKYTMRSGDVIISHEVKDKGLITHIKDHGIGISVEAQKKLFEKFYRVQTEETRNITGTGLGLFIVKQIVEKMNGKIWVVSEESQGSTFSFSLPLTTNIKAS